MDKKKTSSSLGFITRYFLEGLFVLLPLTITVATVVWLTSFFGRQLGPQTVIGGYLKTVGIKIAGDSMSAYTIGWAVVIGVILLLGFIVDIGAKKYIRLSIDSVMQRIPLINKLYKISVQIVAMIDKKEQEEFKGMSVVYCFFGGERGATFLALMPTPKTYILRDVEYHVVLIPSAPVPVGGSMMLVPVDSVEAADMSIEDFMQIYVSMGAASDNILPGTDAEKGRGVNRQQ